MTFVYTFECALARINVEHEPGSRDWNVTIIPVDAPVETITVQREPSNAAAFLAAKEALRTYKEKHELPEIGSEILEAYHSFNN